MRVTVFVPKGRKQLARELRELRGVELVEAGDIDEIIAIGPFGTARGEKEVKIILNQIITPHSK